jgi:uncharacterized membrane protein
VQFNCVKKKTAQKTELNVLWHSTGLPSGLLIFVSSVCLLAHVTKVDLNKAIVCCLLAASAMISSKKEENKA